MSALRNMKISRTLRTICMGVSLLIAVPSIGFSQEAKTYKNKEKPFSVGFFSGAVGWTFPEGEIGNRYGSFMNTNLNLGRKFETNWIIMAEFTFQFGNQNDKRRQEILSEMIIPDATNGFIISTDGSDAGVASCNRNFAGSVKIGKIFPLFPAHPNSGILLSLSAGFLQYQTIFMPTYAHAPQIENDYAKGYDRQMRGFMSGLFLGYWHMSNSRFKNFYAGMEVNIAWTKSTRKYQFDLKGPDSGNYTDQMYTLKAGWVIPFHGRSAEKIYFH